MIPTSPSLLRSAPGAVLSKPRVVVTGLGAVTPFGVGVARLWEGMLAGRSAIRPITGFDTADLPVRIGGEVPDFKAGDHMDRRSAGRMDAFARYAVAAAREAIAMANLTVTDENRNRIATAIASCHGGIASLEKAVAALREHGAARVGPLTIPLSLPNMGGSQISLALGLHGPTVTPAAACASGTQAILDGITMIERGEADVVIAGGTDATLTPLGIAGYAALGALSPGNGDPARVSRPFAASRDGFVLSEGAAAMILESEEHAVRRGATVLAFVPGAGATSDAYHLTSPDPSGAQAARAMSIALERSGLRPEHVDYVAAHATSTKVGDIAETNAIRTAFGEHADRMAVSASKSLVGHLLGAAAALAAVTCVLAIRDGVVPPTINLDDPDPDCDLDYVPHTARQMPVRAAIANGFGFGGQNASVLFARP